MTYDHEIWFSSQTVRSIINILQTVLNIMPKAAPSERHEYDF